jgi:hypothetical protein
MKLKTLLFTCAFFLCSVYAVQAQTIQLTGADICSDGIATTTIGLSKTDTVKAYALYRDGRQQLIRQFKGDSKGNPVPFGSFSAPGVYTAMQFDRFDSMPDPKWGKLIPGEVKIHAVPILLMKQDTIEIKSGEVFSFMPETTITNTHVIWTAILKEGKLKSYYEKGRGLIVLPLVLAGKQAAVVVFTFTPYAPESSGGCMGIPRKLTLKVVPIQP